MKSIADVIAHAPLFNGLPQEYILDLSRIAVKKNYKKGETVFSEGESGTGFYIVGEGMVRIFKVSPEGREQILHIFGPGEPFGEVPVFTGNRFPANAESISKCSLLFFPRTDFVELITKNPALSLNMLGILALRLRHFTDQIENLSLRDVPARLASYLITAVDEQEGKNMVSLNISKGRLASLLGTIPETLSRIFAKMTGENIIEVKGRLIRVIDRQALEMIAGQGK